MNITNKEDLLQVILALEDRLTKIKNIREKDWNSQIDSQGSYNDVRKTLVRVKNSAKEELKQILKNPQGT